MEKELRFNEEAKAKLLSGMEKLALAVGSTLGPKGKCVIIDDYSDGQPHITKDGVTVAKNIFVSDKFENVGVTLLRQAALNTVNTVGDSTTSSTVLAYNMILNAAHSEFKNISNVLKGIEIAKNVVIDTIKEASIDITENEINTVATISSNNDSEIGQLIEDAFKQIGKDGVITVEESSNSQTTIDILQGMQFDRGFVSHWFITDRIKNECVLENPYLLITDQKIELTRDIVNAAEFCAKQHAPLFIIAQDFDDEVIQTMRLNHLQGNLKCCLIKCPSFGEYRKYVLEDLAILTNAKLATYDNGIELKNVDGSMLGRCSKVIVDKNTTTILGGSGNPDSIKDRVESIKNDLKTVLPEDEFMRKFYSERIARLAGGICTIKVGGMSELDMREKKDRVDDAVCATKAALEEGIVPGGGLTYLKAFLKMPTDKNADINCGINIVKIALTSVFDTIVRNAGYNPKEIGKNVFPDKNISWDAENEEYVDFLDKHIINPTKADRLSFENAISILILFLSTNCIIVNKDVFREIN